MKKLCSFLAAFLLAVSFATIAFAEQGAGISMESSTDGKNSTVSVMLSGNTNPEMIQFCMNYDPQKMECIGAYAGGAFDGKGSPTINIEGGKIYFVWDSLNPIESEGVLLKVEFKSINDSSDAEVSIEGGKKLIIAGKDFKNVAPAEVEDLVVFEGSGKTESGGIGLGSDNNPSDNKNEDEPDENQTSTENEDPKENAEAGVTDKEETNTGNGTEDVEPDKEENIGTGESETPSKVTDEEEEAENETTDSETVTEEKDAEVIVNKKEEKNSGLVIAVVFGAVVIAAGAVILFVKSKNKS